MVVRRWPWEGRQSPEDDIEAIRRVTVADVNRVARESNFDHVITTILTPQASGKPVSTKSFGGKESFAPTKTKGVKLPEWARQAVSRMEIPASSLNPFVTHLPNGLELIVQSETVSDSVNVYGRVKNRPNVEAPKGKDGVDDALDQLFPSERSRWIAWPFRKRSMTSPPMNPRGRSSPCKSSAINLTGECNCWRTMESRRPFPKRRSRVLQPELAAAAAGELESPNHQANHAVLSGLFPKDDPSLRETTPDTVKSLTIDDVRNYYRYVYRPDLTTIVVIGNVTPQHAQEVIARYFGNWAAARPKPNILLPPPLLQTRLEPSRCPTPAASRTKPFWRKRCN